MPTHVVIYSKNVGFHWAGSVRQEFLFTCMPIDEFEPQYGDIYWFFV